MWWPWYDTDDYNNDVNNVGVEDDDHDDDDDDDDDGDDDGDGGLW